MQTDHIRSIEISAAVITISSTRTRETDLSGKTIIDLLSQASIPVTHYAIVPDRVEEIQNEVKKALPLAGCLILDGGTGLTHDDCTIEAVTPLLDKVIDGFGELFRWKSFSEIGTSAMLSRTIAGTIDGHAIFCIPGSRAAVTLAVETLIIPEIRHILSHATK
jgi:molybdenum cofactor biosynthesis protein B